MLAQQRLDLPPTALSWVVGGEPCRVLTLNSPRPVVRSLLAAAHEVIAVDADPRRAAALAAHVPARMPRMPPGAALLNLAGRADQLPVQPCSVRVALLGPTLRARPGERPIDHHEVRAQVSRALEPVGWAAGWQIVRDDTVPWVRRLIALMRIVDSTAMAGQGQGCPEHEQFLSGTCFKRPERRDFRLWVPMSRDDLLAMVAGQPAVVRLDEPSHAKLLAKAGAIVDDACAGGDLNLPYALRCWRAPVDHAELTQPIASADSALTIPI